MSVINTQQRSELLEATDAQIEDAVSYADPFVLRGLLYQLTGDEAVAATTSARRSTGGFSHLTGGAEAFSLTDEDVALLRAKTADFLKKYRDEGAGPIDAGPAERLERSLSLTAGEEIPADAIKMWLEELALDPWVRAPEWPATPSPEQLKGLKVLIIGAAMGGLNTAVQLQHEGIDFTILEKNAGVGGTWYENRYPGARVDSPSRAYTHIIGVGFPYPWNFCPWDENLAYFDWLADEYGLRDRIRFETEVKSIIWDDEADEWVVTADGPDGTQVLRANVVFTAVGLLSQPVVPKIEGMATFRGALFHSARWPEDLDLSDKRVAVIGTGCSGYQMSPEIALQAAHVSLFQRTPNWVFPTTGYRSPLPEQVNWLDRNLPYHANYIRFRTHWMTGPNIVGKFLDLDPNWQDEHSRSAVNQMMREGCIAFLTEKLGHRPDLLEKMIPTQPPFSQRPVAVDYEYSVVDALLRDNFALVSEPIVKFTPEGILTEDGVEHKFDVIVLATGFRANQYLWPIEVRGRDGLLITDAWAEDGQRAYLGMMVPGFPNLFMLYGPNQNAYGGGGPVQIMEMITRYAIKCLQRLVLENKRTVEPTEAAYRRYNAQLDEREKLKMYSDSRAHSYYNNEFGRSSTQLPWGTDVMWHWLYEPDYSDLIVS